MVSVCQALQGDCGDSLVMTSPGGWLELEEAPIFTKDGRRFTMALSANGYKQVSTHRHLHTWRKQSNCPGECDQQRH